MEYQLEIKQIVDYPRCRIYREFIRSLMADKDLHINGSSYLFYYIILCSYAIKEWTVFPIWFVLENGYVKPQSYQNGFVHVSSIRPFQYWSTYKSKIISPTRN